MKKVLFIILISCFSLTIISCSDDKEEYSATGTTDNTTTTTDTTAPTVSSTSLSDGAATVVSSISATFSELMDKSTITTNTFTLDDSSGNSVAGTVSSIDSSSATTSTFIPSSTLSRSVEYTATITTGVKDLGGNALASNKTFSFTPLWTTKQLGSSSGDYANDIAIDSSGNFYITGKTSGELDGNTYGGGFGDTILVKYNSSAVKQWTKQIATSSNDTGYGVATDSSGNVFVGGSKSYKFDSSGTQLWTQTIASETMAVATDSSGNIYVAGGTYGGLDGNTNAGNSDLFVVKYNSSGTKQWTKQLGSASSDYDYGVATDSSGNVYVSGDTYGGLDGNTNWQSH